MAGAFPAEGLKSLWEIAPGRGRKATYSPDRIKAVIDATLQSKPKGNTHWSCRLMAASQGMSKSTISNLWQSHNIKPHQTKTFKLSRDPKFLEKLTDVVGLYLNPPDKAIVLCVDEKSQIQALNRTQPGLPLKKGRCGTMTHDYKRNGTTTLFAALDLLAGKVIGDFHKRHRHQEFLKFLRRIDREFPGKTALHLVMDNYGTHGHADVKTWLDKHPPLCYSLRAHQLQLAEPDRALVRRTDQQTHPQRLLLQRRGPRSCYQRVSGRLEREPEAVRLDGYGGVDRRQTRSLPPNSGTDPARLHHTKTAQTFVQLIRGHYTRFLSKLLRPRIAHCAEDRPCREHFR